MATELNLTLWFEEGDPVPTREDLEESLDCVVIYYDNEEEV